jgi:hypothetical protein
MPRRETTDARKWDGQPLQDTRVKVYRFIKIRYAPSCVDTHPVVAHWHIAQCEYPLGVRGNFPAFAGGLTRQRDSCFRRRAIARNDTRQTRPQELWTEGNVEQERKDGKASLTPIERSIHRFGYHNTLMRPLALCYSPVNAGAATELRSYLETNCPVSVEDGVMQMGSDLLDAVEMGLSLDYVIVLLSPDSTQPAWPRARWESILFDQPKQLRTRVAYVLLEDCKFPAILRKEIFFDLARDFSTGRRSLKRWLLSQLTPAPPAPNLPERLAGLSELNIDELEPLADWPDYTQASDRQASLAFAYARHADFEAVVWLNCARRSRVGVLGDVADGLGLRLEGTWEDNTRELTEHCANHRVLLVFENIETGISEIINFGGKASIIVVDSGEVIPRRPLPALLRLFSSWKRNAGKCLAALGDVESHLDSPDILKEEHWSEACSLCSAAVALLKEYGRLAEAHDLLARISSAMQVRGDLAALGKVEWETSWILEQWDQPVQIPGRMAAALSEPTQMLLF